MAETLKQDIQSSLNYQSSSYVLNTNHMWQVISALSDQEAFEKYKKKSKRIIRSLLKEFDAGSQHEEAALKTILAAEKFIGDC